MGESRHEDRVRHERQHALLQMRAALPRSSRSILLNTSSDRLLVQPELEQHLIHDEPLLLPQRVARVDDVQQQIRVARLLERGAERRDEMVRQLADEPDGVGEQHVRVLAEIDLARQRVERREEAVLDEHVRAPRSSRAGSTTCRRSCSRRATP